MARDHISRRVLADAGKAVGDWPGTKNGQDHRVALSEPAMALIDPSQIR